MQKLASLSAFVLLSACHTESPPNEQLIPASELSQAAFGVDSWRLTDDHERLSTEGLRNHEAILELSLHQKNGDVQITTTAPHSWTSTLDEQLDGLPPWERAVLASVDADIATETGRVVPYLRCGTGVVGRLLLVAVSSPRPISTISENWG